MTEHRLTDARIDQLWARSVEEWGQNVNGPAEYLIFARAIEAELAQPDTVLVPREPTIAMLEASARQTSSEEYCSCAEYYDKDEWPVQCLQNSPLIAAARALLEKKT